MTNLIQWGILRSKDYFGDDAHVFRPERWLEVDEGKYAEMAAALALRDAVLRLRRDGAFVAVPLYRVNEQPMGPHPAGSYESKLSFRKARPATHAV